MNSAGILWLTGGAVLGALGNSWLQARATRQRRSQRMPLDPGVVQLRQWIEAAPQGWLLITPNNRIGSLNPKAETLLELEESGLSWRGEPLTELDPAGEVKHLVDLARDKGLPQRGVWPRPKGNLDLRAIPGQQGWVAVVLQGRNPLESQLEQQEQWVSDVAHELKTPLTALRLVGDSLALKAEGRQAVLVERLQRELERLQELVRDLLELSRLDNTTFNEATPQGLIDPIQVATNVWSTLEPLAAERGIRLETDPGPNPDRGAAIDRGRCHQALLNLLDNALRYSPDHGVIEVSIRQRNRWCLIAVRDHGPGLSEQDLERMFQRFYRGDPARARSPRSGSGLGLAIVQQIALSQGGMVRASNHPDGGALLELLVPSSAAR